MSLHDQYPAYGGHGPTDLRLGISLAVIATIFMVLRVYVRLRVNKFGTTALILSLVAWVSPISYLLHPPLHYPLGSTCIGVYTN